MTNQEKKEIVHTTNAPLPLPSVSQAVKYDHMVYVSGVVPLDIETGKVLYPNEIGKQVEVVLQYISEILEKAGSSMDNILKINAFLHDMNSFHEYDNTYASFFGASPPARCTIGIGKFPLEGVCIEIDCIAFCV